MNARSRSGAALVAVLLLLLAVGGLAHGALVIARSELVTSTVRARVLEQQSSARLALRAVTERELGPALDSIRVWGSRVIDAAPVVPEDSILFRRLEREIWWASVVSAPWDGRRPEEGVLLWMLDPVARVLAIEGVASISDGAPLLLSGPIDASGYEMPHESPHGASCEDELPPELSGRSVPELTTVGPGANRPAIGLMAFDTALARTPVVLDSVGSPAPVEDGATCLESEPWNWGDPEHPWRPCGGHVAVRAAPGPVRIEGGAGQGLLAVQGDVTMAEGTRFHGVILTSGRLELAGGSVLTGAAVALGGLHVAADSRVEGSACWALRAFEAGRRVWSVRPLRSEEWVSAAAP